MKKRPPDLSMGWWDPEQEAKTIAGKVAWARTYAERNALLREIGFADYQEYLASDLWRGISARVMAKGKRCWVCRRRASARQCHHDQYTRRNLLGETTEGIYPVCPICHRALEFKAGKKLDLLAARAECRRLRKRKRWPKIVAKRQAKLRRKWKANRRAAKSASEGRRLDAEFTRLVDRDG